MSAGMIALIVLAALPGAIIAVLMVGGILLEIAEWAYSLVWDTRGALEGLFEAVAAIMALAVIGGLIGLVLIGLKVVL